MLEVIDEVPGSSELIKWLGHWPSFHDAEVLDVELHRTGSSTIRVHAFEMTNKVDSRGFFVCDKHVVVSFFLEEIKNLALNYFNGQNVIFGLILKQTADGYELTLDGCHGVEGTVTANRVRIKFEPGIPADSQYLKLGEK